MSWLLKNKFIQSLIKAIGIAFAFIISLILFRRSGVKQGKAEAETEQKDAFIDSVKEFKAIKEAVEAETNEIDDIDESLRDNGWMRDDADK